MDLINVQKTSKGKNVIYLSTPSNPLYHDMDKYLIVEFYNFYEIQISTLQLILFYKHVQIRLKHSK